MKPKLEKFSKRCFQPILRFIIGFVFVLLCYAAIGQEQYVVTATRLNVRKTASAESAIVGGLQKDDIVTVRSFKGGWAEIDFKNGKAFVAKKHIEKKPESVTVTIASEEKELITTPLVSNSEKEKTNVNDDDKKDAGRFCDALNFSLGGRKTSGSPTVTSTTFTFDYESGRFIATSSAFYNLGLGLYFGWAKSSASGYSFKSSNWGVRIPFHFGYMFGNEDKLHAALRGGVYTNFLIGNKMNKETVKVPFKDRFGWTGSAKATIGYGVFCLTAEYLIPFKSGSDGAWMFGLSLGM